MLLDGFDAQGKILRQFIVGIAIQYQFCHLVFSFSQKLAGPQVPGRPFLQLFNVIFLCRSSVPGRKIVMAVFNGVDGIQQLFIIRFFRYDSLHTGLDHFDHFISMCF